MINSTDHQMQVSCNSSSETSEDTQVDREIKNYKLVVDIVLVLLVNFAGYTGNVLTFLVLLRDRAASRSTKSTNFILRALSLSDICFLACSLPVQLVFNLEVAVGAEIALLHVLLPQAVPYFFYAGHAARMLRNWTVVLVSVERWVAIFWPLRASLVCTVRNARVAVATLVAVALLYNVPRFFEVLPGTMEQCVNGTLVKKLESGMGMKMLNDSELYRYVYRTAFYILFVIGGPIAILIVLNALLIRGISKATRMQASLIPSNRSQAATTSTYESGAGGGGRGKMAQVSSPQHVRRQTDTVQNYPRPKRT